MKLHLMMKRAADAAAANEENECDGRRIGISTSTRSNRPVVHPERRWSEPDENQRVVPTSSQSTTKSACTRVSATSADHHEVAPSLREEECDIAQQKPRSSEASVPSSISIVARGAPNRSNGDGHAENQDEDDDASLNSGVTNVEDEEESVVPVTTSPSAPRSRSNKGTGVYFNNREVTEFLHPLQEMPTPPSKTMLSSSLPPLACPIPPVGIPLRRPPMLLKMVQVRELSKLARGTAKRGEDRPNDEMIAPGLVKRRSVSFSSALSGGGCGSTGSAAREAAGAAKRAPPAALAPPPARLAKRVKATPAAAAPPAAAPSSPTRSAGTLGSAANIAKNRGASTEEPSPKKETAASSTTLSDDQRIFVEAALALCNEAPDRDLDEDDEDAFDAAATPVVAENRSKSAGGGIPKTISVISSSAAMPIAACGVSYKRVTISTQSSPKSFSPKMQALPPPPFLLAPAAFYKNNSSIFHNKAH